MSGERVVGVCLALSVCIFAVSMGFVAAGGLGAYGSDSEDERSMKGSESSDTDEEELRHRIRQKQDAFRRKERELQQQERQTLETHVLTGSFSFLQMSNNVLSKVSFYFALELKG